MYGGSSCCLRSPSEGRSSSDILDPNVDNFLELRSCEVVSAAFFLYSSPSVPLLNYQRTPTVDRAVPLDPQTRHLLRMYRGRQRSPSIPGGLHFGRYPPKPPL